MHANSGPGRDLEKTRGRRWRRGQKTELHIGAYTQHIDAYRHIIYAAKLWPGTKTAKTVSCIVSRRSPFWGERRPSFGERWPSFDKI